MSSAEVTALEAGIELDAAVARAIGCTVKGGRGGYWCGCNARNDVHGTPATKRLGDSPPGLFHFSSDLNAAFAAANQYHKPGYEATLFEHSSLGRFPADDWYVTNLDGQRWFGKTPALAICAAILNLRDDKA